MPDELYSEKETKASYELTEAEQAKLDELEDPDAVKSPDFGGVATEEVQNYALSLLLNEETFLKQWGGRIKASYWTEESNQMIAGCLFEHFGKYGIKPEPWVIRNMLAERLEKATPGIKLRNTSKYATVSEFYIPNTESKGYLDDLVKNFVVTASWRKAVQGAIEEHRKNGKFPIADFSAAWRDIEKVAGAGAGRKALTIAELAELPPIQWQIEGHWPVNGFVCVFGPFGSGKSFMALDAALCVATGRPYHGKHVVTPGPVAYVAAEGHSGISKRITAWLRHHETEAPANFVLLPETFDFVGDPTAGATVTDLATQRLGAAPVLIVVDTLARNFGGGDENATKDMGAYVANVAAMGTGSGATVLSVHHVGKDGGRGARGSVSLGAACDSMIELTGAPGIGVTVKCAKQKDAAPFTAYDLEMVSVPETGSIVLKFAGETAKEDGSVTATNLRPVLESLPAEEIKAVPVAAVVAAISKPDTTARRYLDFCVKQEYVHVLTTERRKKYYLTAKGTEQVRLWKLVAND